MSPETFQHLLTLVGPIITKKDTRMREAIGAAERLTLTIHYLAYGDSQQALSFAYRIARSTVSSIIHETCAAIWEALNEVYLRPPRRCHEWKAISEEFNTMWNFPHCMGAIDGKHIAMQCPIKSGSLYYNYKGFFSIVLLAICDAHYTFNFVDIGSYGSNNDSSVLNNSTLGKDAESGSLEFPPSEPLDGFTSTPLPYFFVGDEAFGLKPWMQRPYPGKNLSEDRLIYNYRLSRARRTIENAFGILTARWRIFHRPIQTGIETAENIVKAAICLHNYLRQTNGATYCPSGFVDSEEATGQIRQGEWRAIVSQDGANGALRPLPLPRGARYSAAANDARELIREYVNSDRGSVPWQWDVVRSRGATR